MVVTTLPGMLQGILFTSQCHTGVGAMSSSAGRRRAALYRPWRQFCSARSQSTQFAICLDPYVSKNRNPRSRRSASASIYLQDALLREKDTGVAANEVTGRKSSSRQGLALGPDGYRLGFRTSGYIIYCGRVQIGAKGYRFAAGGQEMAGRRSSAATTPANGHNMCYGIIGVACCNGVNSLPAAQMAVLLYEAAGGAASTAGAMENERCPVTTEQVVIRGTRCSLQTVPPSDCGNERSPPASYSGAMAACLRSNDTECEIENH